jgi:hypothetical protein
LTTLAGRSTTSPAAILFATVSDRMRMRPKVQSSQAARPPAPPTGRGRGAGERAPLRRAKPR